MRQPVQKSNSVSLQSSPSGNALDNLPIQLVGPVCRFFAFWSDTLKGTTGLVTRLLWWMENDDLTILDAVIAMERLMDPERASHADYPGEVLAALSRDILLRGKINQNLLFLLRVEVYRPITSL